MVLAILQDSVTSFTDVLRASEQGFPGSGPIFLTTLGCSGNEKALLDCSSLYPAGVHACDHSQDVWIKCSGITK